MSKARLEARVRAQNKANEEAQRYFYLYREAFKPFIGKKVITQSGFVAKLAAEIEKIRPQVETWKLNVTHHIGYSSDDNISFDVRVVESMNGEGGQAQAEARFVVGRLAKNPHGFNVTDTLEEVFEQPAELKTDYDAHEVVYLRELAKQKRREAQDAENALYPFGENDW